MKVTIPNKIKIGSHIYTIELKPHLHCDDGDYGQISYRKQNIKIWSDAPLSLRNQSLLHEVLHLSQHIYRVEISDADIDRVAETMAQLLDNLDIQFDWSILDNSDKRE